MIQVRPALADLLEADAGLAALVDDRIFHQEAPQGTEYPMVIFHLQDGRPTMRSIKGPPVQGDLWTIKAIATSSDVAEPIALAIDACVSGAELDLEATTLWLERDGDINYPDPDGATTYRHLGGIYRVLVQ